MAAEVEVRLAVQCTGLGGEVINFPPTKFTDTNTPDIYGRVDKVISTTAALVSVLLGIPSTNIVGMAVLARGDTVYINSISTTISTAGQAIPENQAILITSELSAACKWAYKGNAADSAITMVYWGVEA